MAQSALGPVFDMDGAFNDVALTLAPGAHETSVLAQLDRVLDPWGGLGAYGRDRQLSHSIITSELEQNRVMGTAIPAVFLGIAAFLLNLVMSRLIATQRTEIAVLKAFGYSSREVGVHYLQFSLVAVACGAVAGTALGIWSGRAMVELYGDYFNFPILRYELSWTLVAIAVGVSTTAACLGALGAVRRAVDLPPAEAMRPEAPATFKPGLLERAGLGRILPAAGRMILRNVERQPVRSAFTSVGVAFSVAILVVGLFMFDGVRYMMDLQFRVAQREDISVDFNTPLPASVSYELMRLPGVTRSEPFRVVPARLLAGHRKREVAISGIASDSKLRRIVTANGGIQPLPQSGIVLSDMLAKMLHVRTGDTLTLEVLEGARMVRTVPVSGVVEDFMGLSAYMNLAALQQIAGPAQLISGAYMNVQAQHRAALNARLKQLPTIASVASPATMLASFEAQLADSLFIAVGFMLFFASTIAVAVIYNGARIALSERGRELASLRVLGFARREVAAFLLGEQAILTLVAIPLGWLIGYTLAASLVASLQSETYRIPLIVDTRTYLWSALGVVVAAVMSGWIVRRRLDRLDLIAVLKTRE
jgi:putative ABC transport system permease protein